MPFFPSLIWLSNYMLSIPLICGESWLWSFLGLVTSMCFCIQRLAMFGCQLSIYTGCHWCIHCARLHGFFSSTLFMCLRNPRKESFGRLPAVPAIWKHHKAFRLQGLGSVPAVLPGGEAHLRCPRTHRVLSCSLSPSLSSPSLSLSLPPPHNAHSFSPPPV